MGTHLIAIVPTCDCTQDGHCSRYNRVMAGRMRAICRGEAIDPGKAAEYRQLWAMEAGGDGKPVVAAKCPYLGEPVRTPDGDGVKRACAPCGGKVRQVFACEHPARKPDEVTLGDCSACDYRPRPVEGAKAVILKNMLSPGDVTAMSAAIHSLHRAHPGKFVTAVRTTCDAVYEHNPDVVSVERATELGGVEAETHYPAIKQCNQRGIHFMQAYCEFFEEMFQVRVPLATNRPHVYLSKQERTWMNQVWETTGKDMPFWLIGAGHKSDYTAKSYPHYQEIVDRLQGRVLFVQVGRSEHVHRPLRGVVNLLDKTDNRQFIRLVHHCSGVVCSTTWLMHLAAAFEKPAVIIAGGREPRQWNQYPIQTYLSTVGTMPCCEKTSCWRSRTVALGDGGPEDKSLCDYPTFTDPPTPKCMAGITAEDVARAVNVFL